MQRMTSLTGAFAKYFKHRQPEQRRSSTSTRFTDTRSGSLTFSPLRRSYKVVGYAFLIRANQWILKGWRKSSLNDKLTATSPHPSKEVQPQAGLHWRRSGGKHCVSPTPEQHHVLLYGCSLLALLSDDHGCMAFLDLLHPKSPCSTCQEIPPLTYPSLCLC